MERKSQHQVRVQEAAREQERRHEATSGIACPACGGAVAADDEICPHCGARLTHDCTFCGNHLLPGEDECPECGMPVGGIRCPHCGTLNQRTFCRQCNAPLTKAAVRAVEKAREDPVFQECERLAAEVEALEEEMETVAPSEAEALKEEQKKLVVSLNEKLQRMVPPPGSTPKEQMMYYSARKVAVETRHVVRHRAGWVCHYCGCTHSKPIECAKPELGGYWVYEETVLNFLSYE